MMAAAVAKQLVVCKNNYGNETEFEYFYQFQIFVILVFGTHLMHIPNIYMSYHVYNSILEVLRLQQGHQMQVGLVKVGEFRQISRRMSKTVQNRCIVSVKDE